eukprot:226502-Pelagomonas_calceolata.AAC.3
MELKDPVVGQIQGLQGKKASIKTYKIPAIYLGGNPAKRVPKSNVYNVTNAEIWEWKMVPGPFRGDPRPGE